MNSSSLLNDLEACPKRASLSLRLEREALSFHQLLSRGVDFGLAAEVDDPGIAASDEVYRLATARPIETETHDLLGLVEHCASLAEIVTWVLRTGSAWKHPQILDHWVPTCWVGPSGLRRIVLCERWDERRALQEMRSWSTLEGALYGLPATIIAIVLGSMREGRRHGPLTKGWLHPQSRELRFRKRDGGGFEGNWEPVFRERYDGSRDEWLHAMTEDGVTEETIILHPPVEFDAEEAQNIRDLVQRKMAQIGVSDERNLSACFNAIRPCPFRHPCAYFREPEQGKGFVRIEGLTMGEASPLSVRTELQPPL